MVLGSIALSTPSSIVGNTPLEELRVASSIFKEVASQAVSHRTKNGVKIVQKILAKAEAAQAQYSVADVGVAQSGISIPPTNYGDDELAIFGGQTRFLAAKPHSISPQTSEDSFHSFNSSIFSLGPLDDVHPSLIDFLTTAPVARVASRTTFQEIQMTTFGPPLVSSFQDPGFTSPQMEDWPPSLLSSPQSHSDFGNLGDPSTTGLYAFDTFENYLTLPVPVELGPEPSAASPWQDFMKQHSLI
ncbi:hypothetical protein DL96DRAFT_112855 [Flagelloscypha sp. PMI_526]|nr:hypothetical protein DL96DRAFT_112855 [Flagelloscypha sp. PMI_526]